MSFGLSTLKEVSLRDLAIRFAAGAATSLVAALVGSLVAARTAGPLLAFPAIYLAGLTLVERKEGERKAHEVAIGAIVGAVALTAFAIAADVLSNWLAWPLVLLAALVTWVVVAGVGYVLAPEGFAPRDSRYGEPDAAPPAPGR